MPFENGDQPTIPCSPLPKWLIYHCKMVVEQPAEDVLLVRMSVWTRLVFFACAILACTFCAPFLISLHSSLTIKGYRMSGEIVPFAWLAVVVVLALLVLVLATLFLRPIRFDCSVGTVSRGGWVPGWWERNCKDVVAIQICRGKTWVIHGDRARDTKSVPQYQLNLVFHDSPPTRRNLSEQEDLWWAERTAKRIAKFLNVPVLNYAKSVDEADAEAARLLTKRLSHKS